MNEPVYNPRSGRIVSAAMRLAEKLHDGHFRKGTEIPYTSHLWAVAGLVMEMGGDGEAVAAALLHDAIEDRGGKTARNQIYWAVGESVARIVEEVSETDEQPKPPWKVRKQMYLDHMEVASRSAIMICIADKLHNARCTLREPAATRWERFNADRKSQFWWYTSVLDVLQRRTANENQDLQPFVQELRRVLESLFWEEYNL